MASHNRIKYKIIDPNMPHDLIPAHFLDPLKLTKLVPVSGILTCSPGLKQIPLILGLISTSTLLIRKIFPDTLIALIMISHSSFFS